MISLNAIIRVRPGAQDIVRAAFLAVCEAVTANEPDTLGYFVMQSSEDPCLFTTYERFTDHNAMEKHNSSAAVAKFVEDVSAHFDGPIVLRSGEEIFSAKA
jgi:quinol monooxygenase YgiN